MAVQKDDLEVGMKVYVGLFDGKVIRIIDWQNVVMVDVEIGGVIDRYHLSQIELA